MPTGQENQSTIPVQIVLANQLVGQNHNWPRKLTDHFAPETMVDYAIQALQADQTGYKYYLFFSLSLPSLTYLALSADFTSNRRAKFVSGHCTRY